MENAEENSQKNSSSSIDDISGNTENGVFHFMTNNQGLKINDNNNTYKSFVFIKKDLVKKFRERKWKNL